MIIDLHAHLLPDVDGGATTLEDSVKLAQMALDEGITYVVLTPEYVYGEYVNSASDVKQAVLTLREAYAKAGLAIRVYAGHQIAITKEFMEDFNEGELLPLDGRGKYYLVTFPDRKIPDYVYEVIDELLEKGITPIIANPERNTAFQKDINLLYDFVEAGCLAQMSASAYTGEYGPEVQDICYQMLENHLVHVLASDIHQPSQSYNMRKAFKRIEEVYGKEVVRELKENARHIFNGEGIQRKEPIECEEISRKRILGIF